LDAVALPDRPFEWPLLPLDALAVTAAGFQAAVDRLLASLAIVAESKRRVMGPA
jgi:hypothetical protein